jgi:hypothetical protein
MARLPLDLPPDVARAFMDDLKAYVAATTGLAKDEIAARQLRALREYLRPSDGRLRVAEVRALFEELKAQAEAAATPSKETRRRPSKR